MVADQVFASVTLTEDYEGAVIVATTLTTDLLQMEGGTIDTPETNIGTPEEPILQTGSLYVGELNWLGGVLNSTTAEGTIYIAEGGEMNVEVEDGLCGASTVVQMNATYNFGGAGDLSYTGNAGIHLMTGSTFNWNSATGNIRSTGTGFIANNDGTFRRNQLQVGICELPYQQAGDNAELTVPKGTISFTKAPANGVSVDINGGKVYLGGPAPNPTTGTLEATQGFKLRAGKLEVATGSTSAIKGDVTVTGGEVRIGSILAIATLNVDGNFTMTGGTYVQFVKLTAIGEAAGTLNVTKKIDFANGNNAKLEVFTTFEVQGVFRNNQTFVTMNATDGVTGDFATKELDLPGFGSYTVAAGQNLYGLKTPAGIQPG